MTRILRILTLLVVLEISCFETVSADPQVMTHSHIFDMKDLLLISETTFEEMLQRLKDIVEYRAEQGCSVGKNIELEENMVQVISKSFSIVTRNLGMMQDFLSEVSKRFKEEPCIVDNTAGCSYDQWRCDSGQCIPEELFCNGEVNCNDGSDELHNCTSEILLPVPVSNCSHDQFGCMSDGKCIVGWWQCDGVEDCPDGSDEFGCFKPKCSSDQFQCVSLKFCIDRTSVCDGELDCLDGSDEANCTVPGENRESEKEGFYYNFPSYPNITTKSAPLDRSDVLCDNNTFTICKIRNKPSCIPLDWFCNNITDCDDGRDEVGCQTPSSSLTDPSDSLESETYLEYSNYLARNLSTTTPYSFPLKADSYAIRDSLRSFPPEIKSTSRIPPTKLKKEERLFNPEIIRPITRKPIVFNYDNQQWPSSPIEPSSRNSVYKTPHLSTIRDKIHQAINSSEFETVTFPNKTIKVIYDIDRGNLTSDLSTLLGNFPSEDDGEDPQETPSILSRIQSTFYDYLVGLTGGNKTSSSGVEDTRFNLSVTWRQNPCNKMQFPCNAEKQCIPKSSRCDGIIDCEDGADEKGCSREMCNDGFFFCKTFDGDICIPELRLCDGNIDCVNKADEHSCNETIFGDLPFQGRYNTGLDSSLSPNSSDVIEPHTPDWSTYPEPEVALPVPEVHRYPFSGPEVSPEPQVASEAKEHIYPEGEVSEREPQGTSEPEPYAYSEEEYNIHSEVEPEYLELEQSPYFQPKQYPNAKPDESSHAIIPEYSPTTREVRFFNRDPSARLPEGLAYPVTEALRRTAVTTNEPLMSTVGTLKFSTPMTTEGTTMSLPATTSSAAVSCSSGKIFRCKSDGICINMSLRCNGHSDCPDNSDEWNCKVTCESNEFHCLSDYKCISLSWRCDGELDCSDGSDERGCGQVHCNKFGWFKCQSSDACINPSWKCDGAKDCPDGSDELNCPSSTDVATTASTPLTAHGQRFITVTSNYSTPPINSACAEGTFLCISNQVCIPMSWVCDGDRDCVDGSDETSRLCSFTTSSPTASTKRTTVAVTQQTRFQKLAGATRGTHAPSNISQPFFSGVPFLSTTTEQPAPCKTEPGYFGCTDGEKCINVSDVCNDVIDCSDGSDEGRSCNWQKEGFLIVSLGRRLRLYSLDGSRSYRIHHMRHRQYIVGVTYDPVEREVYWSVLENRQGNIYKKRIDGGWQSPTLFLSSSTKLEGLAVDWMARNIYIADTINRRIRVCSLAKADCKTLIRDVAQPRSLQVDLMERKIYWTDAGTPLIEVAGLDGEGRTTLASSKLGWTNGLALDLTLRRVYWMDGRFDAVEYISMDGEDRQVIANTSSVHPFAMALWEDTIYWTDAFRKQALTCTKWNCSNMQFFASSAPATPSGISLYHPTLFEKAPNPCVGNSCSHLCLLSPTSPTGHVCACPDQMTLLDDLMTCA